jgi:hypothetical protein
LRTGFLIMVVVLSVSWLSADDATYVMHACPPYGPAHDAATHLQ